METVPAASHAGSDRLSDLPDCLLDIVLSSLRTRQVVQTSLLSRRWRHLWRSVPCLDIDQRDFKLYEPAPERPGDGASDADWHVYNKARKESLVREVKRQRSFVDFADGVLLLHGACALDAYRLHIVDQELRTDIHRWLRRGLARRPAELFVTYGYRSYHEGFRFNLASGGAGALPVTSRLRRLHLSGLTLAENFAAELRSECPVLEDLELVSCDCDYKFSGRIASRSLKRLHIDGRYGYYNRLNNYIDSLAVPALVSLNLDKTCLPNIEDELQSLAVASIADPDEHAGECRFLKSLRNASVLELRSFTTTGLLEDQPEELREFHNLKTLILIECKLGDSRCQVLSCVLQNVPNLETLVLQDCEISGHCKGKSASSCSGTAFHGCKNRKSIQVKSEKQDVRHVLVAALTQFAKDVAKTHRGNGSHIASLVLANLP